MSGARHGGWRVPRDGAHKFTEADAQGAKPGAVRSKYFPASDALWASRGLVNCQSDVLASGRAAVAQAAVGLAASERRFELLYIYYNESGASSDVQKAEAEEFTRHIAGDLPLHFRRY